MSLPEPVRAASHARALMRIIHAATARNAERATMNLTVRERLVVQRLGLDGDTTIAALGHALGITPSSMTGLVDALEDKGLLRRIAHARDRRATLLSLTRKGRAAFAREIGFYSTLIDQTLSPLGAEATAQVLHALAALDEAGRKENAA